MQATIFDALDTMIIMGLEEEYTQALEHVKHVQWNTSHDLSKTFETNIRYLGGLLAAYDLRNDQVLLDKAIELARKVILPAYDTPNFIPAGYVNVTTTINRGKPVKDGRIILAEFGSLQLELVRLSQLTGEKGYEKIANWVIAKMAEIPTELPGLYSMIWDLDPFRPAVDKSPPTHSFSPPFTTAPRYITISGGADSYYEYLLKTHILMNGKEKLQLNMWVTAVNSMYNYLRSETLQGLVFLGEYHDNYKLLQTAELGCFMPANLLLGSRYLRQPKLQAFAEELLNSCYVAWNHTPTGLAPESWSWIDKQQNIKSFPIEWQTMVALSGFIPLDTKYDLRPETLESIFYFYRLTGDGRYKDMAWQIFQSLEKYCKTPSGYSRIGNVMNKKDVKYHDFQESYFFAETAKYLYLIFSDPQHISLDEYVFNTEGHPFKLETSIRVQASNFASSEEVQDGVFIA
ncbi:maturation of Asn-linked oligosaccharides protein [Apophysomyces ossiformis]|uniref:alpha-1,2-Mannosidase n=1 Tax=Apophysomyces ossiformis TaxID=679940 RepID=A0A8H7BT62_9FUNG|nr:maturation of Asn-linked oligosaccharides protein [Apophysomyces ossiformis]